MKRVLLSAALALAAAVPAHAADPAGAKDARPVTVPFSLLKTKHIAVMIRVNGRGPYRVIFDTGAPMTVLSNKVAREAGLLKNVPKPAFNLFGSGGQVTLKTLEVGGLRAEDLPAVVMDHPTVGALAAALGPIEGIVGFPFFARYKMTLDYQAKRMTFVPSGYDPPDVLQAMMASMMGGGGAKGSVKVLAPAAQWGLVAAKDNDDDDPGVTLKEVLPGSAAAAAGLRAGDRLLTLDGRWTDSVADLYAAAGHVKANTAVKVVVRRDSKEMTLTVTPAAGL
jgi:membrane-associated protease RseP (regulator of RpoE activity)